MLLKDQHIGAYYTAAGLGLSSLLTVQKKINLVCYLQSYSVQFTAFKLIPFQGHRCTSR